jgi:DNA repair protein SbcD/Mre11
VKFVHAADIHLDSPLRGLDRYPGAPSDAMRAASRRALVNLVDLCVEEQAGLLVIAGDLYDGSWKDHGTGLFFASQMARLAQAQVKVVLLRGNHDATSQIAKNLRLPGNVKELAVRKPETVVFDDLGVAVHGQGFATRAVTDDLAARYPEPVPGLVNIGVLHTSMDGREGHEPYAPTTLATLATRGYDYWALGHVHKREVLSRAPWVVFPGNLQGRNAKETGAKGATLVTVREGRIAEVEARALDVVRWAAVGVDAAGCATDGDVLDRVRDALATAVKEADGRAVAARVTVTGESAAHVALASEPERFVAEVRAVATDAGADVWVEKVKIKTRAPLDLVGLRRQPDAIGELARALDALRRDDAALVSLAAGLDELKKKLPAELREGEEALRFDDPAYLRALVDDVEQMILPRLVHAERA